MNRSNNTYRRRTRRGNRKTQNPPTSLVTYTGPLRSPQENLAVIDLVYGYPISANSTGIINTQFTDYPNASPDWTNVIALYAEYRVLSMVVEFNPTVVGAVIGTQAYNILYIVWDATDTATALTSYTQAENYPVKTCRALNARQRIFHRMSGVQESEFGLTSAPLIDYTFKFYADTLTNNANYGRATITWHCQFRGRI